MGDGPKAVGPPPAEFDPSTLGLDTMKDGGRATEESDVGAEPVDVATYRGARRGASAGGAAGASAAVGGGEGEGDRLL